MTAQGNKTQVFADLPWTEQGGGTGIPYLPVAQQPSAVFANAPDAGSDGGSAAAKIAMPSQAPVFSAPPADDVAAAPTPLQAQIGQTSQRLKALQDQDARPYGFAGDASKGLAANHPGVGGKILHALSVAANIGGDIFAPSTMELIPGTQLNRQMQEQGLSSRLQSLTTADVDNQAKLAETAYTQARPAIEMGRMQQRQGIADDKNNTMLAKAGLKQDEDGNLVADEASPAFQSRQVHDAFEQAHQQLMEAEEEVKRASIDPNSPAYKLAVSKANTARVNAGAAVQRAQAYYGKYLQGAYNKGLDGGTLPGSPQIEDGDGNVTVVGSTNAPTAGKAQGAVSKMNDVHGALDQMESAARALTASGQSLNSPEMV